MRFTTKDRGVHQRTLVVEPGGRRRGGSKGRRVLISQKQGNCQYNSTSIYPEDARLLAMNLLQVADECEKD